MKRLPLALRLVLALAVLGASAYLLPSRCTPPEDADAWRRPIRLKGNLKPTILSFTPSSGCAANGVTINGVNFLNTTAVDLNGTTAVFFVNSSTQILTTVPSGASTGPWHVTNAAGTATSASSFTVNACPFAFNLGAATPPTGITTTRTGSDTYAQNGANTVAKYTSALGYVVEDYGDSGGPALWATESYTNWAPSYNDFTNVGYANSGLTVTSNAATDPFGTGTASKIATTVVGTCGTLTAGPLGPLDQLQGFASIFYENGTPAPSPNPGLLGITTGGPAPWTLLTSTTSWQRALINFNKPNFGNRGNYIELSPASWTTPSAVVCDAGATGSANMWGAQTTAVGGYGYVPLTTGASGAAIVQVAAGQLPNMLELNGDWHMEVTAFTDKYFTVISAPAVEATSPFMWEFTTVDGVSHTYINSQSVIASTVNGVAFGGNVNVGSFAYSQYVPTLIKQEIWSQPSIPQAGFNFWINSFRSPASSTPATVVTMHAPSSFFLGSHGGTSNFWDLRFTDLARVTDNVNTAEGIMLGDSLTVVSAPILSVGPFVYNVGEARTRPGIVGLQFLSETISQQQARWDASPQKGQSYVKWVFILAGNYDIAGGATDVATAAALQALITDIHTANPTAKILVAPNMPTNCAYSATQQGYLANYNADILGTGPNPITDPGSVLIRMPLWTQLASGTGAATYCYLPAYDNGDHIIENNLARANVVGPVINSTLVANGLL